MALVCTHLPAMSGVSCGAAWCSDTGAENVSEMVVFGATFCAPADGMVVFRKKLVVVAPPDPEPEPDLVSLVLGVPAEPECLGDDEPRVSSSTTAITTAAPTRSTHGRRRNGLPVLDSRTFMASARSRRCAQLAIRLRPAYGPDGARCVGGGENMSRWGAVLEGDRRHHPGGRRRPAGPGTLPDPPVT